IQTIDSVEFPSRSDSPQIPIQRNPRWDDVLVLPNRSSWLSEYLLIRMWCGGFLPRYHPSADGSGPSGLSFISHARYSLHSIDLFRCESAALRTLLGAGRYGSVHSAHRRIWNTRWDRELQGTVSHVQSRCSMAKQFRSI